MSIQVWQGHGQEAKRGEAGGARITREGKRLGHFSSRVRPRVSQIARRGLIGAPPRGQPWTSAVTLSPGRNGLRAWRMAVLSPLRAPALGRHVHRALWRSVWLDVTPLIAATA